MTTVFYIAAAVAAGATLLAITRLHVFHALLYVIVSLFAVAVIFFTLGAPFAGALEIIIYAGAIMVLFIFAVMLLNLGPAAAGFERKLLTPHMWVGPGLLTLVLVIQWGYIILAGTAETLPQRVGPEAVGRRLLGPYLLGVELASMMLLAGLVGAYHLGRREPLREERGS